VTNTVGAGARLIAIDAATAELRMVRAISLPEAGGVNFLSTPGERQLRIDWSLSLDDIGHSIGVSTNPLYIRWGDPPIGFKLHHTLLHAGMKTIGGELDPAKIPEKVFAYFATKEVQNAAGEGLNYYADWKTRSATTQLLLTTKDGMCEAWGRFLVDSLRAQGIPGVSLTTDSNLKGPESEYLRLVRVDVPGVPIAKRPVLKKHFLVNSWSFVPQIGGGAAPLGVLPAPLRVRMADGRTLSFTHYNLPKEGDSLQPVTGKAEDVMKVSSAAGVYDWDGVSGVVDQVGSTGQNVANPHSIFPNHCLVAIGTKLYDPSYGVIYKDAKEFEANAIAGYCFEQPGLTEAAIATRIGKGLEIDLDANGMANELTPLRLVFFRTNDASSDIVIP
jgi:hypothetical protein